MSSDFWFLDREHKQCGPVGEDELVRLVRTGTIGRETQIWSAGMTEWRMAGQVDRFAPLFGPPGPPGPPALPVDGRASSVSHTGALNASLPVWGLFGRSLLVMIGFLLIIPSPWTGTAFYRWMCERVALPDGKRLTFAGQPADIWYVFVVMSLSIWAGRIDYANLLIIPLSWILGVLFLRWLCAKVGKEDGTLKLSFEGGFLPYIGWNLLLMVSVITIIGWAWVMKFMLQWICRNVRGTTSFEFTATGLSILWRTLVVGLLSALIIPIPWMIQWFTRWMISQVSVAKADASLASP
jgi:GYF domain 2